MTAIARRSDDWVMMRTENTGEGERNWGEGMATKEIG